jgi:hypothetical protein
MTNPLWYLVGAVIVAELYNKYATPQEKYMWEHKVKTHHGGFGALMALGGILTDSPKLIAAGAGLMAHDWKDKDRWFKNSRSDVVF